MAKLTLTDLTNLRNEVSVVATINANFQAIETALENTLSRDGTSPNSLLSDLDMNSNRITNLEDPVEDQDLATKNYVDTVVVDPVFSFNTVARNFLDQSSINSQLDALVVGRRNTGTASQYNFTIGTYSFNSNTTGHSNTGYGYNALYANIDGYYNVAIGQGAMYSNTSGYTSVAIGYEALYSLSGLAYANTAIGYGALRAAITGTQQSTAVGYLTLYKNTTGYQNQAFGNQALFENTTGINNTACGMYALYNNRTADYNVAMGFDAAKQNQIGANNTAIGKGALENSYAGPDNVALGFHAHKGYFLQSLPVTSGSAAGANCTLNMSSGIYTFEAGSQIVVSGVTPSGYNGTFTITASTATSVSYTAGASPGAYVSGGAVSNQTLYTATGNTAIGLGSLANFRTGGNNVAVGYYSGTTLKDADFNTFVGSYSFYNSTLGDNNVGLGYRSGFSNTTGSQNVALGMYAGYSATTEDHNVTIGYQSNYYRTAVNNVAIGSNALLGVVSVSTGGNNVAIGHSSGSGVTTGTYNVFLGANSGLGVTTGGSNIIIGNSTTGVQTGSYNVIIGSPTGLTAALANTVVIADGQGNTRSTINSSGMHTITGSFSRGAPVTKTADFTVAVTENWLINNKAAATCTVTLPAAASFIGREIMLTNYQAFTVVSATSNVIPQAGGAAGTAILAATAGKWATLVSNGTNWVIMQSN